MSSPETPKRTANWICQKCSSPQKVIPGATYHRCDACMAIFRMIWRGGQVDDHSTRQLDDTVFLSETSKESLQHEISELRLNMQRINEVIRQMEMSKGGERLRVLAGLAFISSLVFALFRMTVNGLSVLIHPEITELTTYAVASVSLLLMLVFGIRKTALVRKVNKYLSQRAEIENSLECHEAAWELQYQDDPAPQQEPIPTPEKPAEPVEPRPVPSVSSVQADIIGRFANRKRSREKRLTLRDEDE